MTPAALRWLDRWIGALLCRGFARWRPPSAAAPARKVLCIGLAEMGSIVLAAPAIRRLGERGSEVFFLTFANQREVPVVAGVVDQAQVLVLRTANPFVLLVDVWRLLRWTRQSGIDAVIDLEPCMFFSALLAAASGAANRAGFVHDGTRWQARNALYTLPLPYAPQRHMAESFAALVALVTPALVDGQRKGSHGSTSAIRTPIDQVLPDFNPACQRLIFLNPNAGDAIPQRRWPAPRFVELALRILQAYPEARIALIGSAADEAACARIAAQLPAQRCANLAGRCTIAELPALLAQGHLLISNDSGPAHLAALTSLPVVVLFGPETPALYRPLGNATALYAALPCSPCITPHNLRASACRDNRCMQAISVEQVFAVVETQLAAVPTACERAA